MPLPRSLRTALAAALATLAATATLVALPASPARAAAFCDTGGLVGCRDHSYSGTVDPTQEKPESKVWYHDGRWWAVMVRAAGGGVSIHRADGPSFGEFVDTGVVVDTSASARPDVKWDGTSLWVASHRFSQTKGSGTGATLRRFSYDTANKRFNLAGGPFDMKAPGSNEALVIDRDSTGRLWATWVERTGSGMTPTIQVRVNRSTGPDGATWGTPFTLPVGNAATVSDDDLSSVIAFNDGSPRIGVGFSNQNTDTMYFAVHNDSTAAAESGWTLETMYSGGNAADDHLNMKADPTGRVYVGHKTSSNPLLVFSARAAGGGWQSRAFPASAGTRPQIALDDVKNTAHMFLTSSESGGDIIGASLTMNPLGNFGAKFVAIGPNDQLNNVTTTKQPSSQTGGRTLVLASGDANGTDTYYHRVLGAGGVPDPTSRPAAAIEADRTKGNAPMTVRFTDRSTGLPTEWSWTFGTKGTSAEQNPVFTFTEPGTYQVTLVASNAGGDSDPATVTITVDAALPGRGAVPTGDEVIRLSGDDRVGTALAVSKDAFPRDDSAGAVVLARSDAFADALAGAPLAKRHVAPLLLTPPDALDPRVAAELDRLLAANTTVYLLGGPDALSPAVADAAKGADRTAVRLAGTDRYETAVKIAEDGLASPSDVLLATGTDFPDALSGGAAAAATGRAILLTAGPTLPPSTAAYLAAHPGDRFALGGPAAAAVPTATPLVGNDRFETSRAVAEQFFPAATVFGLASGLVFPDALAAGPSIAAKGGPLLLTFSGVLPAATSGYLTEHKLALAGGVVYGGLSPVGPPVQEAAKTAIT